MKKKRICDFHSMKELQQHLKLLDKEKENIGERLSIVGIVPPDSNRLRSDNDKLDSINQRICSGKQRLNQLSPPWIIWVLNPLLWFMPKDKLEEVKGDLVEWYTEVKHAREYKFGKFVVFLLNLWAIARHVCYKLGFEEIDHFIQKKFRSRKQAER
ncbi:hypothetical protein GWO43_24290 [candidate division KSB1 bacterium]|nr:hypothetical protein [candidate division KSB1 bacterium]NIR69090.1 hypothetical protein [candidate division KSB1 bacterium]NIS27370.1 hypothetical protein [candidate division KSB1 bacterium]NIT73936.1 hypothetical protein [candidate division KSB1 bacterium]NIU28085.1 hypothetical protein [candidate division KSB1 bacterium]